MKSFAATLLMFAIAFTAKASAFAPQSSVVSSTSTSTRASIAAPISMVFGGNDEDKKVLTRENEPEEYFQTNADKMSDSEKLPLALAGIAGITLPFLAGMIALYAAK